MFKCPNLLTHGHGSRLSMSIQLHGLHGCCSFTVERTLVQDGVEHLTGEWSMNKEEI